MTHSTFLSIRKTLLITICALCLLHLSFPANADAAVTLKVPSKLGLKAYWSLNEGTSTVATDFSRNYATGTLTNFASPSSATSGWTLGKLGNALVFDGTNDYVNMATGISGISGNAAFTMCAWINTNSVSTGQAIVTTGNTGSALAAAGLYINSGANGTFSMEFAGSNTVRTAGDVIAAGTWYYVCGVKTAGAINTTSTLYVNGQSIAIAAASSNTPNISTTAASVGSFTSNGSYFNGKIDEVRVYNRALTAAEIVALYKSGATKPAVSKNTSVSSGLIGLWTLDGADMMNSIAVDRSGGGRNITFTGITTSDVRPGKNGQALRFDGTNYGSSASVTWGISNTFSMSVWVKDATSDGQAIMVLGRTSVTDEVMIYLYGASIGFFASQGAGVYTGVYGSDNIYDGHWHHLVATVSGGVHCANVKLYVDGVRQTETCLSDAVASVSDATARKMYLGQRGTWGSCCTEAYAGIIDDARLYNRVLSTTEISQLYRLGSPVKVNLSQKTKNTSGLVGLWSFDGPDMVAGTTAYDRGTGGHDGTLSGLSAASAVPGKVGQALYFDGTSQYIDVGDLDAYNPFSVSAWVKRARTDSGSYEGIIGCSAYNGWTFSFEDVIVHGRLFISKVGIDVVYSTGTITDLNWHHVVLTYDGTNARFYIDGALDSTLSYPGRTFSCLGTYTIGNDNASSPLMGRLDDIRLYNRAISASEVSAIYNRTK